MKNSKSAGKDHLPGDPYQSPLAQSPLDREALIEEEAFLILHSGEIPEVALYSSIHYLSEDPDGPKLTLEDRELEVLKRSVLKRYKKIILRDLRPENRKRRIYRGIKRSIVNFYRLKAFCERERYDIKPFREQVREALVAFLLREAKDLERGNKTAINCALDELLEFLRELGLGNEVVPEKIIKLMTHQPLLEEIC